MITRVLAATLGGGIVCLLLGWLIFGVALFDFFKANTVEYAGLMKNPPDWIPLILFHIAWAGLIAFIFEYWAGIKTFMTGMKGGALITFGVILVFTMQLAAFMNYYKGITPILVDILVATAIGAIGGGVIGLILGKLGEETVTD